MEEELDDLSNAEEDYSDNSPVVEAFDSMFAQAPKEEAEMHDADPIEIADGSVLINQLSASLNDSTDFRTGDVVMQIYDCVSESETGSG